MHHPSVMHRKSWQLSIIGCWNNRRTAVENYTQKCCWLMDCRWPDKQQSESGGKKVFWQSFRTILTVFSTLTNFIFYWLHCFLTILSPGHVFLLRSRLSTVCAEGATYWDTDIVIMDNQLHCWATTTSYYWRSLNNYFPVYHMLPDNNLVPQDQQKTGVFDKEASFTENQESALGRWLLFTASVGKSACAVCVFVWKLLLQKRTKKTFLHPKEP